MGYSKWILLIQKEVYIMNGKTITTLNFMKLTENINSLMVLCNTYIPKDKLEDAKIYIKNIKNASSNLEVLNFIIGEDVNEI